MPRLLGKKPGVVHDPRSFQLARLLTPDMPPVLKQWRIAAKLHVWPMFANDRLGDCTCAARGHGIDAMEWSSGRRDPIKLTDGMIIEAYSRISGYRPDDPSTDQGAYLLDNLRDWWHNGLGVEKDSSPHMIAAYATVKPGDNPQFRQGAHLFGGLYLGLALPVRAQWQDVWDVPATLDADDEPYSWGGHAVWMVGYDARGITLVTWGGEQRATWAWVDRYVDESWAVVSEDFLNRFSRTPQGFDTARLRSWLNELR